MLFSFWVVHSLSTCRFNLLGVLRLDLTLILFFRYLTGRFRIQLNHRYNPRPRAPRPQQQPRGENADGQPQDNADVQQEVEEDNRGIMGEVSDIVIPFISSLSPTWNPYDFDQQQPGGEHAPPVPPANEPANEPAAGPF